jgi:TnpA family transposase
LCFRPIDWELIAQQYDEMVKYATALRSARPQKQDLQAERDSHLENRLVF